MSSLEVVQAHLKRMAAWNAYKRSPCPISLENFRERSEQYQIALAMESASWREVRA